ncbi:MAG: hypothetical protein B6U97_01985 [Candidatus Altiarchaeales archaeon ex4484_96]|nr:MAG: hypothetical protein B6U97_01985 [Candidatus Altiarchaeales archaeon ex4484_96]
MVLNYAQLQSIYRSEKNTPSLVHVEGDFYGGVLALVSQLEGEHRDSVERMFKDITLRRRNKVLMQVMRSLDTEPLNALASEKKLYWALVDVVREYHNLPSEEKPETQNINKQDKETVDRKPKMKGMLFLRLNKALPSIAGSDGENYGPFDENQEVILPEKTARVLIERGVAEEI